MHALVDTYSGLPIFYIITSVNIANVYVAEKLMDDDKNGFTPKYYMIDAGYDKPELYSSVYNKYPGKAIITINWRNIKISSKEVKWNGQLVGSMNYAYVYGSNDNGTIKILCPHACGKGIEWFR